MTKLSMPTSDQVNSALRHVYTAVGVGTAVLVTVGLSQGTATALGLAVHQIGDGVASIIAGVGGLVAAGSGAYAAWTASPFSKLMDAKKNPQIQQLVAVAGTPLAAMADAIPGNKITTTADIASLPTVVKL